MLPFFSHIIPLQGRPALFHQADRVAAGMGVDAVEKVFHYQTGVCEVNEWWPAFLILHPFACADQYSALSISFVNLVSTLPGWKPMVKYY
jgi:hypothetical protein